VIDFYPHKVIDFYPHKNVKKNKKMRIKVLTLFPTMLLYTC